MKKIFLILIFIFVITSLFTLNILAYEANITQEAKTATKDPADAWIVTPLSLIDGDRSTGTSSWQKTRYTSITVTFEREINVSKLVFVVNGIGEYPGSYGALKFPNMSENNFWFHVYLLDQNGNTVKDLGNYQSWNANENQELIIDVKYIDCYQVKVTMDNQYDNSIGLWELEVYEHVSCEYDTLKETLKEPTCIDSGRGVYSCVCGNTKEQDIIPIGNHEYTDYESFIYENGFLAKGLKTYGCPTCNDYITEETRPLFKFLGYSVSRNGKSICAGYIINKECFEDYEVFNSTTVNYGMLCAVSDGINPLNSDGSLVAGINGTSKSLTSTSHSRFDIKVSSNNWLSVADTPLIICAYIIDGDKLTYVCGATNTQNAIPITYNMINT